MVALAPHRNDQNDRGFIPHFNRRSIGPNNGKKPILGTTSVAFSGRRLGLRVKELAPAARIDLAFDEFTRIRRLEVDAAIALLLALRRTLIFGAFLTDLLLRLRLRDRHGGRRCAERKHRTGEHHAARDALATAAAVIHDPAPSSVMFPVTIRRPQIFIRSRLAHFIPELNLTAHETSVPAIGVDLAI